MGAGVVFSDDESIAICIFSDHHTMGIRHTCMRCYVYALLHTRVCTAWMQVSPDGLLLQSSTVADVVQYRFAGGAVAVPIAGAYVEFVERKLLPLGQVRGGGRGRSLTRCMHQ